MARKKMAPETASAFRDLLPRPDREPQGQMWRDLPASPKQIEFAQKLGILTAGLLADLISREMDVRLRDEKDV